MAIDERRGKTGRTTYRARIRRKGFPPMVATFSTREGAEEWSRVTEESMARLVTDEKIAAAARRKRRTRTPGQRIGDAEPHVLPLEEVRRRRSPLPELVGVYVLFSGETVVYVGRTVNGLGRVFNHCRDKVFDSYSFFPVPERVLDDVETLCIHLYKPTLNVKRGSMIAAGLKATGGTEPAPSAAALRERLNERRRG